MKTIEMEIALMEYFNFRIGPIITNVSADSFLVNHECDILRLSASGYATEVEIKISKADLLADKKKKHSHIDPRIKDFYFAVPKELEEFALSNIPDRAGLLVIRKIKIDYVNIVKGFHTVEEYRVEKVRKCEKCKNPVKWSDKTINNLNRLGSMRIHTLKKKIFALSKEN